MIRDIVCSAIFLGGKNKTFKVRKIQRFSSSARKRSSSRVWYYIIKIKIKWEKHSGSKVLRSTLSAAQRFGIIQQRFVWLLMLLLLLVPLLLISHLSDDIFAYRIVTAMIRSHITKLYNFSIFLSSLAQKCNVMMMTPFAAAHIISVCALAWYFFAFSSQKYHHLIIVISIYIFDGACKLSSRPRVGGKDQINLRIGMKVRTKERENWT